MGVRKISLIALSEEIVVPSVQILAGFTVEER